MQPVGSHLCALIPAWTAELGVHEVDVVMPRARLVTVPVPAELATSGALEVIAVDPHPAEAAPWSARIEDGVAEWEVDGGAIASSTAP